MGGGKKMRSNAQFKYAWHLAWLGYIVFVWLSICFSFYFQIICDLSTRCFGFEGHIRIGTRKITKKKPNAHTNIREKKQGIKDCLVPIEIAYAFRIYAAEIIVSRRDFEQLNQTKKWINEIILFENWKTKKKNHWKGAYNCRIQCRIFLLWFVSIKTTARILT